MNVPTHNSSDWLSVEEGEIDADTSGQRGKKGKPSVTNFTRKGVCSTPKEEKETPTTELGGLPQKTKKKHKLTVEKIQYNHHPKWKERKR